MSRDFRMPRGSDGAPLSLLGTAALLAIAVTVAVTAWILVPFISARKPDTASASAPAPAPADPNAFHAEIDRHLAQATGRSLFVIPDPPSDRDRGPHSATYTGPALLFIVNDTAYFADGERVSLAKPQGKSIHLISLRPPWSARIEWEGGEYDVELFKHVPLASLRDSLGKPIPPSDVEDAKPEPPKPGSRAPTSTSTISTAAAPEEHDAEADAETEKEAEPATPADPAHPAPKPPPRPAPSPKPPTPNPNAESPRRDEPDPRQALGARMIPRSPLRPFTGRTAKPRLRGATAHAAALVLAAGAAAGLVPPSEQAPAPAAPAEPVKTPPPAKPDAPERPAASDETTVLAFKGVTVEQVVPFLVEATGKVVMPQADVLARRITILNDQPIARRRAYELVVLALLQVGVAVVEFDDRISLRALEEIDRQDVPVLGPDVPLRGRTNVGSVVAKIFALKSGSAQNVGEQIKGMLPTFAKMSVDADSNQIVVMGNIGLLQHIEEIITSLDTPAAAALSTETFHLRYADSEQIAQNIRDLYGLSNTTGANARNQAQNPFQAFFRGPGGGGGGGAGGAGGRQGGGGAGGAGGGGTQRPGQRGAIDDATTSQNLRVTANNQQNSVTVLAEKQVIEQIRKQVFEAWDRPLSEEAVVPRVYQLRNSDPVKVRDLLNTLFGNGTSSSGAAGQQAGGATGAARPAGAEAGAGRLQGQFSFEAVPESGRVVAVSKSPENFVVIDKIIAELDQPQTAGLPQIVELKHASAEELAEQLNALLSQEGTLAQITKSESGLSTSSSTVSPFANTGATSANGTTTTQQNQQNQNQATTPGAITFWWQRARTPTNSSGTSNLVSKIRIVPVWRQNALMVMAPPEYQSTLVSVIETLDRPGRQVLLSAVIAEINIDDATALGIRWSSQTITPTRGDNSISFTQPSTPLGTQTFTGQKQNLLPGLFDSSVLNVGVNLNVLLQALSEVTKINILSEPRIFTSDNQEADFFSGQDVPFLTSSQTSSSGNLVQSFDYRAVGIALRVRPRITINRDIDLAVNLELSSIEPGQTLFGGFIIDRRETTTHLIIKDGQTVVVSGILRTEDQDTQRKVPLLGDIPIAGALFKSTEKTKSRTELVAFITPHVVGNVEEAADLNAPDREHLSDLREQLSPTPKSPAKPGKTPKSQAQSTPDGQPATGDAEHTSSNW